MSELKPLFVDLDDTYGADELGLPYRDIVGEGYISGLAVSQRAAGINLSVDVAAGSCWVQGDTDTSAQPTYRCRNDAVVNLGITPDATNPLNVIVVAEVLDDTFDGGGSLLWRLRAVHGTAEAVPSDPATPTSAIRLARINVTAADASIANAQIDDLRAPANLGGGNIKLWAKGVDIASAATIAVTHPFHDVTGTVTITSITAQSAGFVVTLQFDGVLTFTDGSNLKISGDFTTAAESTITLVCDGTNWYELGRSPAASTGATVATTIAGLGTASEGKIGLIRAGSTPFDFVLVVYDATYAKWVSAAETFTQAASTPNTNLGTYAVGAYLNPVTGLTGVAFRIVSHIGKSAAGLSLQIRLAALARMSVADGTAGNVQVAYFGGMADNFALYDNTNSNWQTSPTAVTATELAFSVGDTYGRLKFSGWVATAIPSDSYAVWLWQAKKVGGTGTLQLHALTIEGRWVG